MGTEGEVSIDELFTPKDYAIICREYSKLTNERVAIYEVKVDEFYDGLFRVLNLRSRFNPELSYFVTKRENLDRAISLLSADTEVAIDVSSSDLMVRI